MSNPFHTFPHRETIAVFAEMSSEVFRDELQMIVDQFLKLRVQTANGHLAFRYRAPDRADTFLVEMDLSCFRRMRKANLTDWLAADETTIMTKLLSGRPDRTILGIAIQNPDNRTILPMGIAAANANNILTLTYRPLQGGLP